MKFSSTIIFAAKISEKGRPQKVATFVSQTNNIIVEKVKNQIIHK